MASNCGHLVFFKGKVDVNQLGHWKTVSICKDLLHVVHDIRLFTNAETAHKNILSVVKAYVDTDLVKRSDYVALLSAKGTWMWGMTLIKALEAINDSEINPSPMQTLFDWS